MFHVCIIFETIGHEQVAKAFPLSFSSCLCLNLYLYIYGRLLFFLSCGHIHCLLLSITMSVQTSEFLLLITIVMFLPRFSIGLGGGGIIRRRVTDADRAIYSGIIYVTVYSFAANPYFRLEKEQH